MTIERRVPLAGRTTLRVGGPAEAYARCDTLEDVIAARAAARELHLPLLFLGGGSNVLVPDAGVRAFVAHLAMRDVRFRDDGARVLVDAEAGASWDGVVRGAAARSLWGIENLAGIPGTVGAAPVQNIGAYGAELSQTLSHAETLDRSTGNVRTLSVPDMELGYRDSAFKRNKDLVITRVSLVLSRRPAPRLEYRDLALIGERGAPLTTPAQIGEAVREIRRTKFPDLTQEGTAGSFFKNPVVTREEADALARRDPALPRFWQPDGRVKVSLAYILDALLGLKGLAEGGARLFERQPLVIVTREGATAADVERLAREIAVRVREATGIMLEREVETFGASL